MAHLQGSPYELSQHVGLAHFAGVSDAQIGAAIGDVDTAKFSQTERAVLELCTTHRLRGDTVVTGHVALGRPPANATERALGRTIGGPSLRGW